MAQVGLQFKEAGNRRKSGPGTCTSGTVAHSMRNDGRRESSEEHVQWRWVTKWTAFVIALVKGMPALCKNRQVNDEKLGE